MSKNLRVNLRNLKNGISNFIWYAPVIWRDYDWDWGYLVELLGRKLESMETQYRGRDKRRIKECRILCQRLLSGTVPRSQLYFQGLYKLHVVNADQWDMDRLTHLLRRHLLGWWW